MPVSITSKISREEIGNSLIDSHTHACGINYTNYYLEAFPYCCNVTELILNMEKNNIGYAVTFPVVSNINTANSPIIDKEIREVIKKYESCPYYYENLRLLKETEIYGKNKILPFVIISLDSKIEEQIQHIHTLEEKYNIYGFKIHPSSDQKSLLSIINNDTLMRFISENKKPVTIHSSFDDFSLPSSFFPVFEELSDIRFCVAHIGRMEKKFIERLNYYSNIWIDISPLKKLTSYLEEQYIKKNVKVYNFDYSNIIEFVNFLYSNFGDKVIFGTDFPWVNCGYLNNNLSNKLYDEYGENIKILDLLDKSIVDKIANENTKDYLFGKVKERKLIK